MTQQQIRAKYKHLAKKRKRRDPTIGAEFERLEQLCKHPTLCPEYSDTVGGPWYDLVVCRDCGLVKRVD